MTDSTFLDGAANVATAAILLAMLCVAWRLMRGPSSADRIVALDLLGILMVAFAGIFAVTAGETAFLDVALALALVAFLGTVAFARYIERRRHLPDAGDRASRIADTAGPEDAR